jgi:hypothetical protein
MIWNSIDLVVGSVMSVNAIIVIAQLIRLAKVDRAICNRLLLVLYGLCEVGTVSTLFLPSNWSWVYSILVPLAAQGLLCMIYLYLRSRFIFLVLLHKNRIHPSLAAHWTISLSATVLAFLAAFVIYTLPFVANCLQIFAWMTLLYFIRRLAQTNVSDAYQAKNMFRSMLAVLVTSLVFLIGFYLVLYNVLEGDIHNIDRLSNTQKIIFISLSIVFAVIIKLELVSCLGYTTLNLFGCVKFRNPNDEQHQIHLPLQVQEDSRNRA